MSKRNLVAVLLLAVTHLAAAQQDEDGPMSGTASLGYLATSGNTESTSTNATFRLNYRLDTWSQETRLRAVAATTDGAATAEAYAATYKARREVGGERGYVFTSLDWERDRFSAFERRLSEAVGYGRRFVETDRHAFNAELGAGARQATRVDGTDEDEGILRAALDYAWTVNDTTEFTQDLVIASGQSNTSIESVSALRARLVGDIALVLSYRMNHNSEVVEGRENLDRHSAISLEYAF